ncbi:hypothetical protein Psch_03041 [Pelotomaculum schinkii]|uniref:DUF2087 domain-containing protein n=1 Tax=Pelotomaculum schinkii TaxID=78350 RepID=A0A4Y7RB77_9FIRM|nr:DUF2087 domain-containing protein [Pelotomaculum schinkii]TEB05999.1 hypothetical protein Psch_03041 [Pelotomaculum schinkii]
MKISDRFWSASPEELKKGYIEEEAQYICLICGKKIEKGMIYPGEGILYEAGRYIRVHIEEAHGSVFEYLVQLDKRITGLTDHQKSLLQLFYQGKSDGEVQKEMGIGSASTIRNHRFVLKEKERQAKVFLALMELLKDKNKRSPGYLPPHKTAGMIDDRYNITQEEREKVLKTYFPEGTDGLLKTLDMKEKNKLIVLREMTKRFEDEKFYNEKEVNEILKTAHEDFVTLRRYLIEYGFIDRKPDGSRYWLKEGLPEMEEENMDRKKELKQQYKEMKTQGGVFQIRNLKNQKVFVDSIPNLKMKTGKLMLLRSGGYKNRQLQEDWNQFGEDAFVFEVLEVLEEKSDGFFDKADELKKLKTKWIEKLQPFGERGYNQPDKRK